MISLFSNYLKNSSFLFNTNLYFRKLNIIKKTSDIKLDYSTKCKMTTEVKNHSFMCKELQNKMLLRNTYS